MLIIIVFLLVHFMFMGCDNLEYETSRDKVIMAPDNSYSLTIIYDYVSRPVILKNDKKIYEYKGSGFAESVDWDIKWISDDEILLYIVSPKKEKYKNEQFYISID